MKRILVFIIMLTLCCSCEEKTPQQKESERYEHYSEKYQNSSKLFELTYKDKNGEMRTHQFVSITANNYANGFAHWPDCKYCKERGL